MHRQVLERRERRPERLGRGQALERAVVALDRCEGGVSAELGQLRQRQVALDLEELQCNKAAEGWEELRHERVLVEAQLLCLGLEHQKKRCSGPAGICQCRRMRVPYF